MPSLVARPAVGARSPRRSQIWANFTTLSETWQSSRSAGDVQWSLSAHVRTHRRDQGDLPEWNVRRVRLGPRVTLFRTFTLHAEVEATPQERDPFYMRFTDVVPAVEQEQPSRADVRQTRRTRSPSTERHHRRSCSPSTAATSATTSGFPRSTCPASASPVGVAPWVYRGGVYTSGAMNREFGEFSGDYFTLALVATTSRSGSAQKRPCSLAITSTSILTGTTRSRGSWNTSFPSISSSKRPDGALRTDAVERHRIPGTEQPVGAHGACRSST